MKKNTTINKDWTGDRNSIFKTLGSSAHGSYERQSEDYYATEPRAVELLLEQEEFATSIWECASGEGHIAKVLLKHGYIVRQSDIIKRTPETEFHDFLGMGIEDWGGGYYYKPALPLRAGVRGEGTAKRKRRPQGRYVPAAALSGGQGASCVV